MLLYNSCVETNLGDEAFVFQLAAIACFDSHWQYVTSHNMLIRASRKLSAYKQPGNEGTGSTTSMRRLCNLSSMGKFGQGGAKAKLSQGG